MICFYTAIFIFLYSFKMKNLISKKHINLLNYICTTNITGVTIVYIGSK